MIKFFEKVLVFIKEQEVMKEINLRLGNNFKMKSMIVKLKKLIK